MPDVSFDIAYNGNIYEMPVTHEAPKFSVNVDKCKLICAKTVEFYDGVEIGVDVVDMGYSSVCAVVSDSDLFDESHLGHLASLAGIGFSAPSVAVSYDGALKVRSSGDIPFYNSVAVAVFALVRRGIELPRGKTVAVVNGIEHSISVQNGTLTFYLNIKYLS